MANIQDLTCVVLNYVETSENLEACKRLKGAQIIECDREGVGNMARAFNKGLRQVRTRYAWCVTDITFKPAVGYRMLDAIAGNEGCAAIHPRFKSDHYFLRYCTKLKSVPFVEWTAPIIDMEAFDLVGELDEQMPYELFDLDWSYRARMEGWELMCAPHEVDHTYLRHLGTENLVTTIRSHLRGAHLKSTHERMADKWGDNWHLKLWPNHSVSTKQILYIP